MFGQNKVFEEALALYGGSEVVERIKQQGKAALERHAEEVVVTVLVQDVRPFTNFSPHLTAGKLTELLNEYLDEMSGIILHGGGAIASISGNSLIAYWGLDQNDLLAVVSKTKQAGLRLSQKWADFLPQPLMPVHGIDRGAVIRGNFGSRYRMNYTIMGETVNMAVRLCAANFGYQTQTVFSERAIIPGRAEFKFLDAMVVKGRANSERLYSLEEGKLSP